MIKDRRKKFFKLLVVATIIIIVIASFYLLLGYFFRKYFEINSWITLIINSLVTVITSIATITSVLISIWYADNLRKKENDGKIKKLNKIIYLEIEESVLCIKSLFIEYIRCCKNNMSKDNLNFEEWLFYDVTTDLKDYIYEVMMYYNGKDNESIVRIKEIFNAYVLCIKKYKSTRDIQTVIPLIEINLLGEEANEILGFTFDFKNVFDEATGDVRVEPVVNEEYRKKLQKFIDKYKGNEKELLLKTELETAMDFLKGECEN